MNQSPEKFFENSDGFPIGLFSSNNYMENEHHHIENELFYLTEGEVIFGIDRYEIHLHAGSILFLPAETEHYLKKISPDSSYHYYAVVFANGMLGNKGDPIRETFDNIRISRFITLPQNILSDIKETAERTKNKGFGKELFLKSTLYEIIAHIIKTKQYVEISNQIGHEDKTTLTAINSALNYIREHYQENISLDDILHVTNYSKSHFIRLFKKYTGMNITQYINKYRIEKSCLDLIYTKKNITEIATENGFNNIQYFSKTFKDYMNCTPKKYQNNGKSIILPSSVANIK
jgi:AraC-like DNA-binding protein